MWHHQGLWGIICCHRSAAEHGVGAALTLQRRGGGSPESLRWGLWSFGWRWTDPPPSGFVRLRPHFAARQNRLQFKRTGQNPPNEMATREVSTGLVWVNAHACMYVWIPAQSEAVLKVREWQAKEKCWQRDDFILFGISCLGRRGASWQRKETRLTLNPTRQAALCHATQNQTCTHFPSNHRVVQVNQITCNLISFLLSFKMCSKVKLYCKRAFFLTYHELDRIPEWLCKRF